MRTPAVLRDTRGIFVAFSNPCVAVWPILHLSDHRAAITSAQHGTALARAASLVTLDG
ncbi:MAG: hypothetical protein WAX14_06885 [Rhodococcus sp. (in: high G+C Gram-positive bacteria)]|uniref:hypothetical protein n=1 Tax=Rhodococcus sp. TaxID=1831 RepID=UPI003BB49C23